MICLDYVLRHSVDQFTNYGLTLSPSKGRRYPVKKITAVDYADDIALLADDNANIQNLLHALEQQSEMIGLRINAKKTEYMSFQQTGPIRTRDRTHLQRVDDIEYLGSHIESTERMFE